MDQLKTTTVSYGNDLYAIDQQMVRAFLIVGAEKALLLDTGAVPVNIRNIIAEVTTLPVTVVLTHSDGDHLGNLSAFEEAWIGEADLQAAQEHEGCGQVILHPLAEDQVFDLGGRKLRVIPAPGHTPGSVCLLDEENKLLFSGDTVSFGPVFMFGQRRNMKDYLNTLQTLKEMKDQGIFDTVYCCHNTCPVSADTVEELIACVQGIRNRTIHGEPTPIHGQTPLLGKYGSCGILFENRPMKVAVLWSSPNLDGLTAAVKDRLSDGLRQVGADIDEIHLNRKIIEHCQACGNGWGTCNKTGVCVRKDDFADVYQRLRDADGIAFISAVYYKCSLYFAWASWLSFFSRQAD